MPKNKQGYEKVLSEKVTLLESKVAKLAQDGNLIASTLKTHGDALIDMSKSIGKVAEAVEEVMEVITIIHKEKK
jgi:uncharacterized protein YoxC